ncbi:MAG: hypothetical protein OEZ35_04130 [Candidatus Bathyarchaeota archaeon]|nr:hypothetical protein [Candidatus Bathyarchaeota archaeon]
MRITKTNVLEKWANRYLKVVNTWLAKLEEESRKMWAFQLYRYCKTVVKTPDELLAMKKDKSSTEAEFLLDNFVANSPFTNSVTYNIASAVKSFYKYNYRSLERASGIVTLEKVKPYRRHSKEKLLKIYRSTQNPRDRALITFVWSTAIAKGSLTKIKWNHLEPDWEKQELPHISLPDKIIKGKGRGRYRGVEQHTFLTPEAKRDLMDYKDWFERTRGAKLKPDDPIFVDLRSGTKVKPIGNATLGQLAFVLSNRSGIPFSWHDARRYVETALEEIRINPNWARKIRGRKVRGEEAPYSRPAIEQLRAKYKEAVHLLEFTQPTQLMELQRRQEIVEEIQSKILSAKPLTDQDRENITRYRIRLGYRPPKKKQRTRPNGDCENGVNCGERFEKIKEGELLTYLRNGWQIVKETNNGKEVIVRKQ